MDYENDKLSPNRLEISGRIKWYDVSKGYGFVEPHDAAPGEEDIFFHSTTKGITDVGELCEGVCVICYVELTERGASALAIYRDHEAEQPPPLHEGLVQATDHELLPARVKWYHPVKGYGFANVLGSSQDVFIHAEVLRKYGFLQVLPGEAILLRQGDCHRGKIAVEIRCWSFAE